MRTIAALALLLTAAHAADWSLDSLVRRDMGWRDVAVGTAVETSTTNEFTAQGVPRKMVLKKIETLLRKTRDEIVLRVEENGVTRERTIRLREAYDLEASSKVEKVTVGGEAFSCTLQRVKRKDERGRPETITAWVHLKHGVLKFETEGIVMQVKRLDFSRTVGGLNLAACRVLTVSGGGMEGESIMCPHVPGYLVHRNVKVNRDGVSGTQIAELIAFRRGTGKIVAVKGQKTQGAKSDDVTPELVEAYIKVQHQLKKDEASNIQKISQDAGFRDMGHYLKIAQKIKIAYKGIKRGDSGTQREQIDKQIKQMEKMLAGNPAALKQATQAMREARDRLPTKKDMEIVGKYEKQLDEVEKK